LRRCRVFFEVDAAGAQRGFEAIDAPGETRDLLLQILFGVPFRIVWRCSFHR